MSRIVILTEGKTNPVDAKTAVGVVRYRTRDVVALFDRNLAGSTCQDVFGVGGDIPVIGDLADVQADTLLIGISPPGGQLPVAWRELLHDALDRGWNIISGLHVFLGDDPGLAERALASGARIQDLRRPAADLKVAADEVRFSDCFRVHTVGHDCNVGKMVTAIELTREFKRRGDKTKFIATGQTGIMIEGDGVPVDAVVSDFVAGAIEAEVLRAAPDNDVVCVEGQGSLFHPMFSGVTLGLLHGCAPHAMILCVDPTRRLVRHCKLPVPPVSEVIAAYESMAQILVADARVLGVAANTSRLEVAEAEDVLAGLRSETGLVVVDPIRENSAALVDAIDAHRRAL